MNTSTGPRWALAIVAALGMTACASTFSLEAVGSVAGASGRAKIGYDGREVRAEQLPDNARADVRFYDANGNEVPNSGANGVGQGEKVLVPAGATHCTVSGASSATSCTGCAPSGGGGGGGGGPGSGGGGMAELPKNDAELAALAPPVQQQRSPAIPRHPGAANSIHSKWIYVFTLDGDFDGTTAWSNVMASFEVQGGLDASQMGARIAGILTAGPGAPVPNGVTVDTYVRFSPEALGGRLVVADKTHAITQAAMDWNGSPYASPTSNSTMYAMQNGWKVFEVFVPQADIQFATPGSGAGNRLDLTWQTFEDATPNEVHQDSYYAIP